MFHTVSPEVFGEWLVAEQLAYLDDQLTQGNLEQLWRLCSRSMDSGPVVHLSALSVARGLTIGGRSLLALRPSTLASVLAVHGLERPAEEAWRLAELGDLVSFCLLDRYLRRHDPARWDTLVEEVEGQAETLLVSGDQPPEGLLMRLQGAQQRVLRQRFPDAWASWSDAWRSAARSAITTLAQRPRDVSQANAERLLSQQVYTDPGHFLLELLQNADDAGASEFSVEFASDRLTVRHNGAPFDFRDLVGILSIGQTTKRSTQIGYFGVGFKSVFEVTDRPRLYSGHFAFEIADISVPRALAPQAEGDRDTVLVLPFKPGLDSRLYWQKALDIQPALLLNVPHLRRVCWQGHEEITISLCQAEGEVVVLRHRDGESRYLLWSGTYCHPGQRPPGKPVQAGVHLAIPVDGQTPATSLYSFLPISEDSGLAFIVGSHFDVPVDRERLDVTSTWNQGVIGSIPRILADNIAGDPERGWRLLSLMPLPEDALGPLFLNLPAELVKLFSELPVVPGGRRPAEVRLLARELEPFFDLEQEPLLIAPGDQRQRRWLELLGAARYAVGELLEQLKAGFLPGVLAQKNMAHWSLLHGLLMYDIDLVDAPVFLDSDLEPVARPPIVDAVWRELFVTAPRSLHPQWREFPDSAALVAKLGLPRFDWIDLLHELRTNGLANMHSEKLFERLVEAPRGVTLACLELPLFSDQFGQPGPLVPNGAYHVGLVAAAPDLPMALLPQARFLLSSPALDWLLDTLRWPRFDLPALVDALEWQELSADQADQLLASVESCQVEWKAHSLERLSGLSIFEGSHGQRLPLSRLWRYDDHELALLLPERPHLAAGSVSARVVEKLALQHRLSRAELDCLLDELPGNQPEAALEFLASRASSLSRSQIERVFRLPLFDGKPLAWPDQGGGLTAAKPEYVQLFRALGRHVIDRYMVEVLLPLLRACAYPLLGLTQLVEALEVAPPEPALLPLLHETLKAEGASLQLAFSKEVRQGLPIWLALSGRVLSSLEVPPGPQLAALTGRQNDLRAQPDELLEELFPLLDGDSYLRRVLSREAKVGRPLAEQPAWCDTVSKVDAVAAHLPLAYLMVSAQELLCDRPLHQASPLAYPWLSRSPLAGELVHPDSSVEQKRDCTPLEAPLVLETFFPLRHEPAMRKAFYAYLLAELGPVASQPEARSFLLEVALWRSAGGHWKSLDELILDPEMPDLGGDWSPHAEIPAELLNLLETVLGVGRPDPLTLLGEHLLPAYLQRPTARGSILEVMARIAQGVENSKLRRTLRGASGSGSFPLPDGSDLLEAYHPPEDLDGLQGLAVAPSQHLSFLRRLGLGYLPPARSLAGVALTFDDGMALLRLVEWAWQQQPEQLEPLWETLSGLAWLPSHDGSLKLPRQLFVRTPEIEELVGSSPELFVKHRLVVGLARRLGLKQDSELDAQLVLRHLRYQVTRAQRVSGRMYSYLEDCLVNGRLSPLYLKEQLKAVPWIWTDEGEYRLPCHVLAVPAFRFFGPHRGTWEGAHQRYPRLAELFGVASSVNERVVLDFLREVHQSVELQPSRRLLRACLALLGDRDADLPREWRVLPASDAATEQLVLVAANQVGLVRSNSPTLSALFAQSGRLLVVDPGDGETSVSLERLYQRLGVPRLRDAYTVRPDRSSRELGPEIADQVVAFRVLLRNLAAVLPRLRAARPEWEQGEWLESSRLNHFMTSGSVRVLQDLRLTYELPQVASVAVEAAAAFDPLRSELLVGAPAMAHPGRYAVALAEGLLDLIYQGPGSEGLVDLLNLLIPLGQRQAMDSYLDRRHFPRPTESSPAQGVRERVGEILDYGLHKLLERRFAELSGLDWDSWRRLDLELPDSPALAARALLRSLGVSEPQGEMLEAVAAMLSAASLEDVVAPMGEQDAPTEPTALAGDSRSSTAAAQPVSTSFAVVARPPAVAEPSAGLVSVGQKVLGRLGQWLGVTPAPTADVLGLRTTPVPDMAESYRHPPSRHLLVSSKALRGHDLYCLSSVGVDFDPRRQMYLPASIPWTNSFVASGRTLEISGRLSEPDQVLPTPLHSRLMRPPTVRGGRATLRGPDRLGLCRLRLDNPEAEVAYTVELCAPPDLESGVNDTVASDPRLVKPTAPLSALPPLVLEWISWARSSGLPSWQLAHRARDFVVSHYAYDLSFMDAPPTLELAARPFKGDENRLLTVLHAGAGGRYLGRGVCLELAAVLLEMLRRARVPAVLASAWMLDEGLIHVPDHALVLALLPGARGGVWVPLEASSQRLSRSSEPAELSRGDLLQGAADVVLGPAFVAPLEAEARAHAQEQALLSVLGSPRRLEVLLECFARSGRYLREIDDELQWLAARGYLTVEREHLYRVAPTVAGRRREG